MLSKKSSKHMVILSFLGLFPAFSIHILEGVKNPEFQICFGARNCIGRDDYGKYGGEEHFTKMHCVRITNP